jgi:hypothetical protein
MDSATWGFVGTLVGASVSVFTTLINSRHSARLQEKVNTSERSERAREFQRNNLLELQESLSKYLRLIGRAHLEELESFRKNSGEVNHISEGLDQELNLSVRKLLILNERISNDALRNNLKELRQKMNNVLFAKSAIESKEKLKKSTDYFEQFMEQLGIVLRSNF